MKALVIVSLGLYANLASAWCLGPCITIRMSDLDPTRVLRGGPINLGGAVIKMPSLGQDLTRFWNNVADLATFGETGRQRDQERANAKEETAKAVADGATKALGEKKNGLQRTLSVVDAEVEDWRQFAKIAPEALKFQDALIKSVTQEIETRIKLSAELRTAKNNQQLGGVALQMITESLMPQPMTSSDSETRAGLTATYDKAVLEIKSIAQKNNLTVALFLSRAIASADEGSLNDALNQVSSLNAQTVAMQAVAQQNLDQALSKQTELKTELAELK